MEVTLRATPNGAIGSTLGSEAETLSNVNPDFLPKPAAPVQLGEDEAPKGDPIEGNPPIEDGAGDAGEPGGEGETPEPREFKYSEETYLAAREEADAAGFERGRVEALNSDRTRRQALVSQFEAEQEDQAVYLREITADLTQAGLPPEEIQAHVLKARNRYDLMIETALGIEGEAYHQAIVQGVPEDRRADLLARIDVLESPSAVALVFADFVALDQPSVAHATPEELLKRNKGLATHLSTEKDNAFNAGRAQGQKDPVDGRDPAGDHGSTSSRDWDAYQRLSIDEKAAMPDEERRRIIEADRLRRSRGG